MTNLGLRKIILYIAIIALLGLSLILWFNTPDLFTYFNQAFCAH